MGKTATEAFGGGTQNSRRGELSPHDSSHPRHLDIESKMESLDERGEEMRSAGRDLIENPSARNGAIESISQNYHRVGEGNIGEKYAGGRIF